MVRLSPTRSNSRSCSTRSSFTCSLGDVLLISSRKMVPPWAASNRPVLFSTAPVNAPLTCPNSSLSSRFSCSAPQLTRMNGPSDALAELVDGPGDDFLAGAGLADEQDVRGAWRGEANEAIDVLHGRRAAHDLGQRRLDVLISGHRPIASGRGSQESVHSDDGQN